MDAPSSVPDPIALIVVEDSRDDFDLLIARVRAGGMPVVARRVETAGELRRELASGPCDIVVSDHHLPQFGSFDDYGALFDAITTALRP